MQRLRHAGWTLLQWRDHAAPWSRDPDWDRERAIDALLEAVEILGALAERASWRDDPVFKNLAAARALAVEIGRARQEGPLDYDGWESTLVDLSKNRELARHKGGRQAYAPGISRDDILGARAQLIESLGAFQRTADADLAARLRDDLADLVVAYDEAKQAQGALDFLDLLVRARDLVRDNRRGEAELPGALHEAVRRRVPGHRSAAGRAACPARGRRVEPRRDSPDWRTAVVRPGALFIVGDPKQSIYRFRRADVGVYRDVCARLEAGGRHARAAAGEFQGARRTSSARSTPPSRP